MNHCNYPFYYQAKRNLHIMKTLLEDTTSLQTEHEGHSVDEEGKAQPTAASKIANVKSLNRISSFEDDNAAIQWSFRNNPNAEAFRRSMLPFYLLKEDKDWTYPRYIEQSNLA